jgi:hypothetical protein
MSKSILTGPARSGGGATMNKNVRAPIKGGNPKQRNITPDAAASIGRAVGNHASEGAEGGGYTTKRPNAPLYVEAKAPSDLGNKVARNVGRGGPGAGRVIHPSGSQGLHGPVAGSPKPGGRDILGAFGPESKRR